jgi:Major Facilitator Superfamily
MQACQTNPQCNVAAEVLPASPQSSTRSLSTGAMTAFSFASAMLIAASSSAVTPLYHLYQASMHLTPFWITIVFASYVASLLTALLTVGGLSDYVGRRPVILAALLLNAAAMILFSEARDVGQLILARVVQGLCVGVGTTAMGAAILDTNRARGPLLNSVTAFLGMTAGSLGAAALITFASDPLHRVYEVLLGWTALMIVLLYVMPESSTQKTGALASLRPHVRVPPQSRAILARLTPANVAAWALGGLYLSLMPTVVATAMGVATPWVDRGRDLQGLSGAAPDRDEHRHTGVWRGGVDDRHRAAASGCAARRNRDRRGGIRVNLLGYAARVAAHRRTPSARRTALGVLPAILSGVQPARGGGRIIGATDRAFDHRLYLRRRHYPARLHIDDGVASDGSLTG